MPRKTAIEEGLRRLNTGGNLAAWGRSAKVGEVNDLARLLGVRPRPTKAATVSAISRAARPALVKEGLSALTSGRGFRAWGRRVRAAEVSALARQVGVPAKGTKAVMLEAIQTEADRIKIVERQTKEIPKQTDRFARRSAQTFEAARVRLFESLATVVADTVPGRMGAFHRAIREWGTQLKRRMKADFRQTEANMHAVASDHFKELFDFDGAKARLRSMRALRQFDAAIDKLVAEIAIRLTRSLPLKVKQHPLKTARELAGKGKRSIVNGYRHRVRLTARMETLRAYNEAQLAIAETFDTPEGWRLRKRIVEIFDYRNHPFSRAADGVTAPISRPFRVATSTVQKMATAMRKSATGVFWPIHNGHYVGMSLPAHYNDRGRVVVELVAG